LFRSINVFIDTSDIRLEICLRRAIKYRVIVIVTRPNVVVVVDRDAGVDTISHSPPADRFNLGNPPCRPLPMCRLRSTSGRFSFGMRKIASRLSPFVRQREEVKRRQRAHPRTRRRKPTGNDEETEVDVGCGGRLTTSTCASRRDADHVRRQQTGGNAPLIVDKCGALNEVLLSRFDDNWTAN
jgi:hypothetical protein